MVDVSSLTDDELRQQLVDYGVNVGPVVSSTRVFYEKKLIKLIESGGQPTQETESEEEEEEEDEEVEDEEVQINYRKEQQIYTPPPPMRIQVQEGYTPVTKQRKASPTRAATVTHRPVASTSTTEQKQTSGPAPDKKPTKASGGMALWVKLLFIIVVAILVYLVVININPSAQNRIPMSLEEGV